MMRVCQTSALPALLARFAEQMAVYLPAEEDGCVRFSRLAEGTVYCDRIPTATSPKGLFFPQSEDLMTFHVQGKSIDIADIPRENEPFAVFGVRACDVHALSLLDRVFLSDPVDTYYAARRQNGVLITMACDRPAATCFCGTFGIDAASPDGDIVCTLAGDNYYFEAKTDKGAHLLACADSLTCEADTDALTQVQHTIRTRLAALPLSDVSADAFGAGNTATYFDLPVWDRLSSACLGCGTCTFVCPTCQCYDIRDYDTGHGVIRFRCWDSCMYSDFTKMSAGQPRTTKAARFRQRFLHKLVYFPDNNDGVFGCVGCGRCVKHCPVSAHIVTVMRTLGGDRDATV